MKNRDNLPDPLIMRKIQEFYLIQGGVGSKMEPILSPDSPFPGNGVRHGPGFGGLSTPKRGVTGGSFSGAVSVVGVTRVDAGFFLFLAEKNFPEKSLNIFYEKFLQRLLWLMNDHEKKLCGAVNPEKILLRGWGCRENILLMIEWIT